MKIYIETLRLILREWEENDIQPFYEMNSNERTMEFFLNSLTEEESLALYHRIKDEFDTYGYGLYAVERKDNHQFIGFTGFHRFTFDADFAPGVEISWRLKPDAWGNGFATEAAMACLKYAESILKFKEIYSFTALPNKRSERVMQKIGLELVKEFDHPLVPVGHPLLRHLLYRKELINE